MSQTAKARRVQISRSIKVQSAIDAGCTRVSEIARHSQLTPFQVRQTLRRMGQGDLIQKRSSPRSTRERFARRPTPQQFLIALELVQLDTKRLAGPPHPSEIRWHLEQLMQCIIPDRVVADMYNAHIRGRAVTSRENTPGRKPILRGENLEALYHAMRPAFEENRATPLLLQKLANTILAQDPSEPRRITRTSAYRYLHELSHRYRTEHQAAGAAVPARRPTEPAPAPEED